MNPQLQRVFKVAFVANALLMQLKCEDSKAFDELKKELEAILKESKSYFKADVKKIPLADYPLEISEEQLKKLETDLETVKHNLKKKADKYNDLSKKSLEYISSVIELFATEKAFIDACDEVVKLLLTEKNSNLDPQLLKFLNYFQIKSPLLTIKAEALFSDCFDHKMLVSIDQLNFHSSLLEEMNKVIPGKEFEAYQEKLNKNSKEYMSVIQTMKVNTPALYSKLENELIKPTQRMMRHTLTLTEVKKNAEHLGSLGKQVSEVYQVVSNRTLFFNNNHEKLLPKKEEEEKMTHKYIRINALLALGEGLLEDIKKIDEKINVSDMSVLLNTYYRALLAQAKKDEEAFTQLEKELSQQLVPLEDEAYKKFEKHFLGNEKNLFEKIGKGLKDACELKISGLKKDKKNQSAVDTFSKYSQQFSLYMESISAEFHLEDFKGPKLQFVFD